MLEQYLSPQGRLSLRVHQHQKVAPAASSWRPEPRNKPQCGAYESPAFEILYGGAAGGGKSDLILGLARNKHIRSLLLRRTFPDLERSLISRSLEFFGEANQYNGSKHVWSIAWQRIEFGHMEIIGSANAPKDEGQYASAAYDFIGFDQLEQFPQYAYEFMLSRARSTTNQVVQVVSTANPVGEGVEWIMQRWRAWLDETYPRPAQSGEIRWFKRDERGNDVECESDDPDGVSRTFIAAGLKDNPFLGDDYRRVLNMLPEPLRSALLNGDWKAAITDDAYQVIPRAWVKQAMARWTEHAPQEGQRFTAVDVARGGDDFTVLSRRISSWFQRNERHSGHTTPDGQSVAALVANEPNAIGMDVIGVGASGYDISKASKHVIPINFAAGSERTDKSGELKFVNKRAEYYWLFREALDPASGQSIALPPDPVLLADLCAPRWKMQTSGIQIEPKEDIKKRLGRSPDDGDAVVMCWSGLNEGAGHLPDAQPTQPSKWHESPTRDQAGAGAGTSAGWHDRDQRDDGTWKKY